MSDTDATIVTTPTRRSRTKLFLWGFGALIVIVAATAAILLTTFPNAIIRYVVEPKLKQLVVDRLGLRYALEMKSMKLSKNKDSLILIGVRITDNGRTAKGSTDTSAKNFGEETPLDRLTTDTVMITGLEYWKLIFQRGLFANTISIRSPKIYLRPGTLPKFEKNTTLLPGFLPAVSSKIVKVENAEVYLSNETIPASFGPHPTILPAGGVLVKKASLEFRDFFLDEPTLKNANSTFFCKSATFHAEDISQVDSLGVTAIRVASVDGDLIDSSMNVHNVQTNALIEEVRTVSVQRIDFAGLDWFAALAGRGLHARSVAISTPQIYLQDVATLRAHPNRHIAASDFIPLPTLLPNVSVDDVEVSNAEVYALLPQARTATALKRIALSLNKFAIDTATPFANVSSFFSTSARFGIEGKSTVHTALGTLQIGPVRGTDKAIAVSDVRLDPTIKGLKLVKLKSAEIGGLDIWKLLMREGLFATSVKVQSPVIYLDKSLTPPMTSFDSVLSSDPLALVRGFKEYPLPMLLPVASVGNLTIIGGAVHGIHLLDDPKNPPGAGDSLRGLNISLHNLQLNQQSWTRNRGMLFSDAGNFSIAAMTQHTPGATYSYSEGGVKGDLRKRTITIIDIRMLPLISEDSFGNAFPFRTERFDFLAPKIRMTGVDFQKLLTGSGVAAASIQADDWKLHVYGDRRHPEAPHVSMAKYPHELFQQIRMPIDIGRIDAHDGFIRFRESWPDTTAPGTITLTHVNAHVGKLATQRSSRNDTAWTPIDGDFMMMNAGLVRFNIGYQLLNTQLSVVCRGSVGAMDAALFNEFLAQTEPFTLTGVVRSADFNFALHDTMMTGTLAPVYDSLHVKFFRWDRFPPGFVSFFANALFMRSHNSLDRGDNPLATADISARIDPDVSLFWALWHPIRNGIGDIIRIPDWVW